ncbi:MAG: RNA polymerase sigma factor, partial [Longimicrobiales bacterium]
ASASLSETQREVFLRVDVEQGDQKEVAEALGIRFGTLRTTLHFARKKMAAALREREEIA